MDGSHGRISYRFVRRDFLPYRCVWFLIAFYTIQKDEHCLKKVKSRHFPQFQLQVPGSGSEKDDTSHLSWLTLSSLGPLNEVLSMVACGSVAFILLSLSESHIVPLVHRLTNCQLGAAQPARTTNGAATPKPKPGPGSVYTTLVKPSIPASPGESPPTPLESKPPVAPEALVAPVVKTHSFILFIYLHTTN